MTGAPKNQLVDTFPFSILGPPSSHLDFAGGAALYAVSKWPRHRYFLTYSFWNMAPTGAVVRALPYLQRWATTIKLQTGGQAERQTDRTKYWVRLTLWLKSPLLGVCVPKDHNKVVIGGTQIHITPPNSTMQSFVIGHKDMWSLYRVFNNDSAKFFALDLD